MPKQQEYSSGEDQLLGLREAQWEASGKGSIHDLLYGNFIDLRGKQYSSGLLEGQQNKAGGIGKENILMEKVHIC